MVPVTGGSILIHGALSYMSGKDTYHNIVCFDRSKNYLAARSVLRRGMFSTTMKSFLFGRDLFCLN